VDVTRTDPKCCPEIVYYPVNYVILMLCMLCCYKTTVDIVWDLIESYAVTLMEELG
jgi:hypothetical protein